jgi:HNH endonuclease
LSGKLAGNEHRESMTLAPCIFCRALNVERSREHVVQAALGGSLTLPNEVCDECNATFSPLDKDLIEHANLFALGRVSSLLGLGLQEDPDAGVRLTARLGVKGDEKGLVAAPPQFFRHHNGSWQLRGPSTEALQAMTRELAAPQADVTESVDSDEEGKAPSALAVVRTAPATFLVRGSIASEVQALAKTLREQGLQLEVTDDVDEWVPPTQVRPIDIKTSFPVGNISRCLAKMALDYICCLFGSDVALDRAFDRVRRFARYGEESFIDFVTPAILHRTQQDGVRGYAHPARHALVLNQIETESLYRVAVSVVLYGKAMGIVRLAATSTPILPLGTWRVTYFNHEQRTFEHLTVPDDGLRCFVNIEALVPGAGELLEDA